jgi:hypothetical protein
MIFQITEDGENMALLRVVECNSDSFSSSEYGDIITRSLKLFEEIGEDDGWDTDNIDDFVEFHNLRSVLILERIFVEDEIEFKQ